MMGWMAPLRHLSAKLLSDRISSEWDPKHHDKTVDIGSSQRSAAKTRARSQRKKSEAGCWRWRKSGTL
jgi:hypothetical protein